MKILCTIVFTSSDAISDAFLWRRYVDQVDKSKGPQHMRELVRQRQADLQRLWRSPSMTQSPADKTYEDNHDENVVEDSFLHSSKGMCIRYHAF